MRLCPVRVEDAIRFLEGRAEAGEELAFPRLSDLLIAQRRIDETITVLRRWAVISVSTFISSAAEPLLVKLLADHGRIAQLREEVTAGTPGAVQQLERIRRSDEA